MSHSWLRTDISANRYVDTYFKGFVDISGGDLYLRHGQMGIGTTNPSETLDVSGNVAITGTNLYIGNDANDSLRFNHVNNGTTSYSYIDYNDNGSLYFRPTSDGSYPTTMTLDKDGKVGIGTTNPGTALQISSSSGLRLTNTETKSSANDRIGYIDFNNGASGRGAAIESCVNEDGDNNADLRFMTTLDYVNTYVERMRIDRRGNVGIGTTSPTTKLHIQDFFKAGEWAPFGGIYVLAGGYNTDSVTINTGITVNDPEVYWTKGTDDTYGNLVVNANFVPNTYVKITMRAKSSSASTYFTFRNPATNEGILYSSGSSIFSAADTFETIVFYVTIPSDGTSSGYLNIYGQDITITQLDIERQSTQAFKLIAGYDNTASLNDVNLNNAHLIIQSNASGSTDVDEIAFRSINNLADARIGYKQRIAFYGCRELVNRAHEVAAIECLYDTTGVNAVSSSHLIFKTHPQTGQESFERMRIDASGNVGIGTTTPSSNLQINGNLSIYDNYRGFFIDSRTGDGSFDFFSTFLGQGVKRTGYKAFEVISDGGNAGLSAIMMERRNIRFYTGDYIGEDENQTLNHTDLQAKERMVINVEGNVGIGTASPASGYKLDVNGTIHGTSLDINSSNFTVDSAGNISANSLSTATLNNGADLSLPITGGTLALISDLHSAVSLENTNYLSLSGQQITGETIPVASGGTNIISYTAGDILYATGATTLTKLSKGANSTVLQVNSAGTLQYGTVSNAMLAGSIANGKLVNSAITIADNPIALGGSITADTIAENIGSGKITNAMLDGSITNGKLANSAITIAGTTTSLGSSIAANTIASAIQSHITDVGELSSLDVSGPVHVYSGSGGEGGEITLAYPGITSSGTQNQWHIDVNASNTFRIFRCEGSSCVNAIDISTNGSVSAQKGINTHVSYFGNMAIGNVGHSDHAGISFHSNISNPNPGKNYALIQSSGGQTYLNSSSGQSITFQVDNTTVMNLDYRGYLGIGTASPTYPFQVETIFLAGSPGYYAYFKFNGTNLESDKSNNDRNVSIFARASIWTADYIISSSDQRIKTNILDIQDDAALQTLRSIQPKTYNYKDVVSKGNSTVYGFIAQQIKEVLPDAVSTESSSIPNIYENTEVSTINGIYNTISFTNFDTADLDASSNVIVVKDLQNKDHTVTITEVIDNKTIRVDTDLSEWMGAVDASNETVIPNDVQTYSQVILDASNNVILENYDITSIASMDASDASDASDNVVGKMADLTGDNTIDSSGNYVDASGNTIAAINADGHYIDASGNYFDADGNFKDASGSLIGTYKAEWKNVIIHGTSIFVYGQEVDDFHTLNKSAIFTVATAALQEVDRQLQAEKAKTATLESQMADLLARVTALESA